MDQDAGERLFARHVRALQRWASGRLPKWAGDVADTDDLVQETLLQTFKRIGQFEPRGVGSLQAYLRQAILKWALRLARPGALIVVDNVVRKGALVNADSNDPGVLGMRRLIEMIAAEPKVTAPLIQTVGSKGHDGFLMALVSPGP